MPNLVPYIIIAVVGVLMVAAIYSAPAVDLTEIRKLIVYLEASAEAAALAAARLKAWAQSFQDVGHAQRMLQIQVSREPMSIGEQQRQRAEAIRAQVEAQFQERLQRAYEQWQIDHDNVRHNHTRASAWNQAQRERALIDKEGGVE